MNTNKLTQKSAEVLQNAQSVAVSYSNQTLQPEHLLLSLLHGARTALTDSCLQKWVLM